MKTAPLPLDVQDFLFKQGQTAQVFDGFNVIPKACNLLSADVKRGLLYIGHDNKLNVVKPGKGKELEWKIELELPGIISHVALNCDCSLLAICLSRPSALIYNADLIYQNKLDLIHEIRLSSSFGEVLVSDLKWNPAIPDLLCSVTCDHTIGCFQVKKDSKSGVQTIGLEKVQGLQALCVSWSPKGKQLVIGSKDGSITQLKPELKVARQIPGPQPFEGSIISILWISNFQFCVCYLNLENQFINVVIVDAPKGEAMASFTTYEDVTFGSGSLDDLKYYFEHIPEWGVIIAASSHSSEVVVLGTCDNGGTWCQWQLTEGSAQLPLIRKEEIETFPMGIAVDRSPSHKLPWGTDATLPNPVPVLRILSTSGQLCSYHIINLKENHPAICTPPTEVIATPIQPPAYAPPLHVSFNLPSTATSTPRSKLTETILEIPKPQSTFGEPKNMNTFSMENKETVNVNVNKTDYRMNTILGQGDSKLPPGYPIQSQMGIKPPSLPVVKDLNFSNVTQQNVSQKLDIKNSSVPKQIGSGEPVANKPKGDDAQAAVSQPLVKEQQPKKVDKLFDDTICYYAYCEEQIRFEKELKSRLELAMSEVGTDEERQKLTEKSIIIEEFLRELNETTNSLRSDIAYLKSLLLQSFAWLEESKSKNSANTNLIKRNNSDSNKLAELQHLFYYTQTQLIQATKVVDLEWAERTSQEFSKMNIPSIEKIYQTLIRHNQIISEEKNKISTLSKKWRNIGRISKNTSNLDESMSNLNLSQSSNMQVIDNVIDLRCKMIASNTCRFSREKQLKLRNLLLESEPKIIRASRPTELHERLEETLSSIASKSKANINKSAMEIKSSNSPKPKSQNPLSSLDNLVSGMGTIEKNISPKNKPFTVPSLSNTSMPPVSVNLGFKENISNSFEKFTFGQSNQPNLVTPKKDTKINLSNTNTSVGKVSPRLEENSGSISITSSPATNLLKSGNIPNVPALSKTSFSFSPVPTATNLPTAPAKLENNAVFNFSNKSNPLSVNQNPTSSIDFSSLSFGSKSGISISPVTATNTSSTSLFKTSQANSPQNLFANSALTITPTKPPATNPVTSETTIGKLDTVKKTILTPPKSQSSNTDFKLVSTPSTCATSSPIISTLNSSSPSLSKAVLSPVSSVVSPTTSSNNLTFGGLESLSFDGSKPSANSTSQAATSAPFSFSISKTSVTSSNIPPASASLSPSSTASIFSGKATITGGSTESAGNIFGSKPATAASIFGSGDSTKPSFGATAIFGNSVTPVTTTSSGTTTIFGSNAKSSPTTFEASTTTSSSVFGSVTTSSVSMFGGNSTTSSSSVFGVAPSISMFSSNSAATIASTNTTTTAIFGTNSMSTTASVFGTNSTSTTTSIFGTSSATTASSLFGANTSTTTASSLFGANSSTTTSPSLFGANSSTTTASSLFGANSSTTTSSSLFGSNSSTTTASSLFGANTSTTTPVFGANTSATPSVFGTNTSTTPSLFGTNSSTTSSVFGTNTSTTTPVFGANSTTTTSSIFGNNSSSTTSSIFGTSSAPTTTNSVFGSTASSTAFGSNNLFGGSSLNSSQSLFGSNATSPPAFGTPTTTASTSLFGSSSPANGTSLFGSAVTSAAAAPAPSFGSPTNTGSIFGGAPSFGTPSTPSGTGTSSVFGQSPTFGSKPVFGSATPDFGAAKMGFGSTFGSPQAFGSSPGFGSPPGLGTSSPLGGGANSMNKVFGESGGGNMTFEALGSQSSGGLTFGSLVQKSPEPEKPSFTGGSSFSSWR